MSKVPLCRIVLSSQLPGDEIESLETSLRINAVKLQKSPSRVVGADDIIFVFAVVSGVAATAQLVDYGITVAKAINNWRRKLREKGIEPEGKLEHPERPPLDLKEASDEEVEEWF